MENLERISGKTCVWKIKALKSTVVPEELEHCRNNCLIYNEGNCSRYIPVSNYQIRIKGMKEYYPSHFR